MPIEQVKPKAIFFKIVLFPTLIAVVVFSMVVYQYYLDFDTKLNAKYQAVENAILRTEKVLKVLNFTIATNFANNKPKEDVGYQHKVQISRSFCRILPDESFDRSNAFTHGESSLRFDYMVLAKPEFCNQENSDYIRLLDKLSLAPMLSLLNGLDPFSTGMYFISISDFGLISPKSLGMTMDIPTLNAIKKRDYWNQAVAGEKDIRLNGPNIDVVSGKQIITLSMPVYNQQRMVGINLIDIMLDELIPPVDGETERTIFIGNPDRGLAYPNPYHIYKMQLGDINSNQVIYINWSTSEQIKAFFAEEAEILITLLIIYLASVVSMVNWRLHIEKSQYSRLSQLDSMTGLLNRRGFEENYDQEKKLKYQAIGIYDIDNFKSINDTYGHDVGDDVIIYTANQLQQYSRSRDLVARFGGEEFVVYMTANDKSSFEAAFDKIRKKIAAKSTDVLDSGFTVSGGVYVSRVDANKTLDEQVKQADLNLYQAKNSGKNKVVQS